MPQYCIINITVQEDLLTLYWRLGVLCRNCQYKIRHFCFNLSMLNDMWHKIASIKSPINFPQANSPNITLANKSFCTVLYCIGILIVIWQNKTYHFEPLCACSIAHRHKFVKLKPANH